MKSRASCCPAWRAWAPPWREGFKEFLPSQCSLVLVEPAHAAERSLHGLHSFLHIAWGTYLLKSQLLLLLQNLETAIVLCSFVQPCCAKKPKSTNRLTVCSLGDISTTILWKYICLYRGKVAFGTAFFPNLPLSRLHIKYTFNSPNNYTVMTVQMELEELEELP